MKRQILTYKNSSGETEDLIPYVDGYGVVIGGTNLVDYLDQIESTFSKALLFLGAFADETALLTAYPNGSDLEEGTYAIVADTDTLYIYDTDNAEWLATASNISGIMELNGLTPVSGALTITGGDINSTVSSAEVQTQTITAHLNNLYSENDTQNTEMGNLYNESIGTLYATTSSIDNGTLTYTATVSARDYNRAVFTAYIRANDNADGTENVQFTITDGTHTNTYPVYYSTDTNLESQVKYKQLHAKLGFRGYRSPKNTSGRSPEARCFVYLYDTGSKAYIYDYSSMPISRTEIYSIAQNSWIWNSTLNEYYQDIDFRTLSSEAIKVKPTYVVLSINKQVNDRITTAVIDYRIDNTYDKIRLYSDEQFAGSIAILFNYE